MGPGLPVAGRTPPRPEGGRRPRRSTRIATLALLLLLPLPWRAAPPSAGPGTSWRLDGRLQLDGVALDPPGEVRWLAAGRPQLVGERVLEAFGAAPRAVPLTGGDASGSPAVAVPAAAAAALVAAGRIPPGSSVDARIVLAVGGLDLARAVGGLRLGDSNGLAVAVAVLRAAGALDLGDARVAATGRIGADGSVLPVGGIAPKARAAARSGVNLLLVPASQVDAARTAVGGRGPRVIGIPDLDGLLGPDPLT